MSQMHIKDGDSWRPMTAADLSGFAVVGVPTEEQKQAFRTLYGLAELPNGAVSGVAIGQNGDLVGVDGPLLDLDAARTLLSATGGVSESQLGLLSPSPDEVVRLNDGPNKGALLIWAQAAGAAAYSWCWWLWPQAAYEG